MNSGLDVTKDGKTTIFTLNRPHIKNAMNVALVEDFREKFAEFDASDQKVAIITGAGKHFSGGADVSDIPILWKAMPTIGLKTNKPIICAVNGMCVGGAMVMTIMADLCVAAETAQFHYPEARAGLTGGMVATLAQRIPHKFAMEIMLMADPIPARRAYEMGLVNKVVPHGEELAAALAMAREIETMAPQVLWTLKQLVTEHTLIQTPVERMARTQRDMEAVSKSQDRAEGIAAFLEGRTPTFIGG